MPTTATAIEVLDAQHRPDNRRWLRCRATGPDGRGVTYEVPALMRPDLPLPPPSKPFAEAPGYEDVPVRRSRQIC